MNKDWVKYAPYIVITVCFLLQCNFFVTPQKLGDTKEDILQKVSETYATKRENDKMETKLNNMELKIDKIYEIVSIRSKFDE